MPRPIWNGTLSFGLLNIPVSLMPGERRTDLSFRMLDSRNHARVRYERVNAETGEEVPWDQIVKAYEYDKESYVVLEESDFSAAASEGREAVEVEAFVELGDIAPQYFERPYVLVPGRKAEKGYVLLRDTLKATGRAGIARVVIRTREYLAAVVPQGVALMLLLLRFEQELVDPQDYRLPEGKSADFRISKRELDMARQLIESMATDWKPGDYQDEFRQRLHDVIEKRLRQQGVVEAADVEPPEAGEGASTNVVDFMSLLSQSIKDQRRTPAARQATAATAPRGKATKAAKSAKSAKSAAKKSPAKKSPAKKAPAKKSPAKKSPAKKAPAKKAPGKNPGKSAAGGKSAPKRRAA